MSRKRTITEVESDDSIGTRAKKERAKKTEASAMRASVITLSITENPSRDGAARLSRVNQKVLSTIKEKLSLAFKLHRSDKSERETKAHQEMKVALKLMAQYRINQADILGSKEEPENSHGDGEEHQFVEIKSTVNTTARNHHWINMLSFAVGILFDCEHYSAVHSFTLETIGRREATRAAAFSLEMAHNRIMERSERTNFKLVYRTSAADAIFDFGVAELKEEVRVMLDKAKINDKVEQKIREHQNSDEESSNPPTIILCDYGPVEPESDDEVSDLEDDEMYIDFQARDHDDDEDIILRGSSYRPNDAAERNRTRLDLPQIQLLTPFIKDTSKAIEIDDNWSQRKRALLNKASKFERPFPPCETWAHWEAYYQGRWDALEIWLELKDLAAKG